MKSTISAPLHIAYGADEALPDSAVGQDVSDALYHTVHSYPGGVTALASRLGMSANTLTHKVNPNNTTHHLHPKEVVAVMHMSGNAAALHAMAAQVGYTCMRALPDQSEGDPVEAFMRLQMAFGDLVRAVADPLSHSADAVSRNEMRRAEAMAGDAHTAIGHLLACMRGRMRKVPDKDAAAR